MKGMLSESEALTLKEAEATASATARSLPILPLLSHNPTSTTARDGGRLRPAEEPRLKAEGNLTRAPPSCECLDNILGQQPSRSERRWVHIRSLPAGGRGRGKSGGGGAALVQLLMPRSASETDADTGEKELARVERCWQLVGKEDGPNRFTYTRAAGRMKRHQGPRFILWYVHF